VLDLMMPGMDGFEVLRRLRAAPATADVPVLMYSAHATASDRVRATAFGADDFADKGRTEWPDLLARIERLSGRPLGGEGDPGGPVGRPI
jgi:DNA-binding response OmpR family regulator